MSLSVSKPKPLNHAVSRLPVCWGRISAGFPLEAIADAQREGLRSLLSEAGRYALRVGDDAMLEAGIYSGDIVIVQSQQGFRDGDIVVALIDNEQLSLTRLRSLDNGRVRLYCTNASRDGRDFARERIAVQGKLIGQLRYLR